MNVLVTGASGFIAKHLIPRLLKEGHNVVAHDSVAPQFQASSRLSFIQGDLADIEKHSELARMQFGTSKVDITHCVHLAAIASPRIAQQNPGAAWLANVTGTHNVLRLLQAMKTRRIIFISSAHVYGISPKYMPSDESHPLALHDTYTTTKIMGEELCKLFYENHGISYTTLRLFNGYGPGQNPDYFIGMKIKQGKDGHMTLRGADVTKDWVYIDDVVDAIVRALGTEYVGPLNVGTGIEGSLRTIAQQIADSFKADLVLEKDDDPGPTRMCAANQRIQDTLGWKPTISLEEGLRRTIEASR